MAPEGIPLAPRAPSQDFDLHGYASVRAPVGSAPFLSPGRQDEMTSGTRRIDGTGSRQRDGTRQQARETADPTRAVERLPLAGTAAMPFATRGPHVTGRSPCCISHERSPKGDIDARGACRRSPKRMTGLGLLAARGSASGSKQLADPDEPRDLLGLLPRTG